MKLDGPLAVLARAGGVYLGPVGYAAQVTAELEAYQAVDPVGCVEELEWMVEHASPAGRWYAASLLGRLDATLGDAAWERLVGDDSSFTYAPGGCSMMPMTLDEAARAQLGRAVADSPVDPPGRRGPGMLLVILPALVFAAAVLWLVLR